MTLFKKASNYARENPLNAVYMVLIVLIIMHLGYRYVNITKPIKPPEYDTVK